MDDPANSLPDLSAGDPTLEAAPRHESPTAISGNSSTARPDRAPVALVEGSGPALTQETELLLRGRLRLAAMLMFLGFLVFVPQHYLRADFGMASGAFLFVFHLVVTAVLALLAGMFCYRRRYRRITLPQLRLAELAMFGLVAAFSATLQYFTVVVQCRQLCEMRNVMDCEATRLTLSGGVWLLLIFTYALFVPNTWRRAAMVIALLAGLPVVTILVTIWFHQDVRQVLDFDELAGFALKMAVAGITGVFGVDTIGSLRREVFEARQLGQYRLTRRIGVGGMGEVYLAEHQLMKRPCVVKLIRPDKAGDLRVLARFQREVRATAKLSHWNTVEIFDYGSTEDGTFYYVMEYLPGMSLAELVGRFGPMPPERVVHLLRQVCDALTEAHAAGLIHRDIKPGNVFAAQRGGVFDVAKLLDFGLVKPMADEQSIQLTAEGSITGSPLFMSPEQATGDVEPDARSDIYALGAVGYFLLTGRPPFEGNKPIQVMIAHVHDAVVPPSNYRPEIPDDLEGIIVRCLAKAPSERFQNAEQLAEALAQCEVADQWTRLQAAQWWQQPKEQGLPV